MLYILYWRIGSEFRIRILVLFSIEKAAISIDKFAVLTVDREWEHLQCHKSSIFQYNNHHFLLKNHHFLLKNLHDILNSPAR